ncbi:MAG: YebC/PmpR family DNA-binding transcriptional regulator [Patescibacteria group bacterium]|nr:YebC/PmpR family DNA-binding transcriptional regulator [Patescibacteria group bacterium]
MAGHSKWANIKRKKGLNDAARASLFTKLSRAITMAVQRGGGANPEFNPMLRIAIERARSENMPKENIRRAIEKGSGSDATVISSIVYEAFGPSGTLMLIKVATDNPNRTYADVRLILDRNGGKLAVPGAVSHQFRHMALVVVDLPEQTEQSEDSILELLERTGAEEYEQDDSSISLYFPFERMGTIMKEYPVEETYRPHLSIVLPDSAAEQELARVIERLEEHEDVQAVFTNVSFRFL